jgi:hypothetical protein
MLCFEQDLGKILSVLSIEIRECTHGMLKKRRETNKKKKTGTHIHEKSHFHKARYILIFKGKKKSKEKLKMHKRI